MHDAAHVDEGEEEDVHVRRVEHAQLGDAAARTVAVHNAAGRRGRGDDVFCGRVLVYAYTGLHGVRGYLKIDVMSD